MYLDTYYFKQVKGEGDIFYLLPPAIKSIYQLTEKLINQIGHWETFLVDDLYSLYSSVLLFTSILKNALHLLALLKTEEEEKYPSYKPLLHDLRQALLLLGDDAMTFIESLASTAQAFDQNNYLSSQISMLAQGLLDKLLTCDDLKTLHPKICDFAKQRLFQPMLTTEKMKNELDPTSGIHIKRTSELSLR